MRVIATIITGIFVFALPSVLGKLELRNSAIKAKRIRIALLLLYLAAVAIITLGVRAYDDETVINLKLFNCYERIWFQLSNSIRRYGHRYDLQQIRLMRNGISNIILNVFLFVPLGYLLPRALQKTDKWWIVLLAGLVLSLTVEVLQLMLHRGWFDMDDLFHNALGAVIGWLCRDGVRKAEVYSQ